LNKSIDVLKILTVALWHNPGEGSEKRGRNVGKNMGYVEGEGEFENSGQEPLRPLKRAQKILNFFKRV